MGPSVTQLRSARGRRRPIGGGRLRPRTSRGLDHRHDGCLEVADAYLRSRPDMGADRWAASRRTCHPPESHRSPMQLTSSRRRNKGRGPARLDLARSRRASVRPVDLTADRTAKPGELTRKSPTKLRRSIRAPRSYPEPRSAGAEDAIRGFRILDARARVDAVVRGTGRHSMTAGARDCRTAPPTGTWQQEYC